VDVDDCAAEYPRLLTMQLNTARSDAKDMNEFMMFWRDDGFFEAISCY
jgi:hypothetical protein